MARIPIMFFVAFLAGLTARANQAKNAHNIAVLPHGNRVVVYLERGNEYRAVDSMFFGAFYNERQPTMGFQSALDSLKEQILSFRDIAIGAKGWIAIPTGDNQDIKVYKFDSLGAISRLPNLQFPPDYRLVCTQFIDDVLYIGGYRKGGSQSLWVIDLAHYRSGVRALPLPEGIAGRVNKQVDDLVVTGDRLVAVDDLIFPKFFLIYDVEEPTSPTAAGYYKIQPHGVYESINQASLGNNWISTLSTSSGRMTFEEHVALYEVCGLKERIVLSNIRRATRWVAYPELREDTVTTWSSISFLGDTLLIAASQRGIGYFYPEEYMTSRDTSSGALDYIRYWRPNWLADEEAVLDIVVFPGQAQVGIVTARDGRLESTLMRSDSLFDEPEQ